MTCFNTSKRLAWPSSVADKHPAQCNRIQQHTDQMPTSTEQLLTVWHEIVNPT